MAESGLEDEPLQHVIRPRPPWRTAELTECGLPVTGHPVITREEFAVKLKRLGKTRTSMTTCITCWHTANRWPDWDTNPVACIQRETYGTSQYHGTGRGSRFRDELNALTELVARHRDEFDTILTSLSNTLHLDDARNNRRRRHG